jgi:hypothetical protein
LLILRIGRTVGFWWEVSEVAAKADPQRVLFFLPEEGHPSGFERRALYREFRERAGRILAKTLPEDLGGAEFLWFGSNWEPIPLAPGQPRWLAKLKYRECPGSVVYRLSLTPVLRALGAEPPPLEPVFRLGSLRDLNDIFGIPVSKTGKGSSTDTLAWGLMMAFAVLSLVALFLIAIATVGRIAPGYSEGKASIEVASPGHSEGKASIEVALSMSRGSFLLKVEPATLVVDLEGNRGPFKAKLIATRVLYTGPLSIELIDLPPGMTASKVGLARGETGADIEIKVSAGLKAGNKHVRIKAGHPNGPSREFPGFLVLIRGRADIGSQVKVIGRQEGPLAVPAADRAPRAPLNRRSVPSVGFGPAAIAKPSTTPSRTLSGRVPTSHPGRG